MIFLSSRHIPRLVKLLYIESLSHTLPKSPWSLPTGLPAGRQGRQAVTELKGY